MSPKVSDGRGKTDRLDKRLLVSAGNTPPKATITSPPESNSRVPGQDISFSGRATAEQDVALAGYKLRSSLILHHYPSAGSCHKHPREEDRGSNGSFVAPEAHGGNSSYLELRLTAADSRGLTDTDSVRFNP